MKLILVRHGETDWNHEKKIQGVSDIGLNERGIDQAKRLALSLRDEKIEAIVTSPLKRAYDTALAISRFHNAEIRVEDDLHELNTGDLEGLTFSEVLARYPSFIKEWRTDRSSPILPNGESLVELQNRVWAVIRRIINDTKNTVIVSHHFALAAILCRIQNLDISQVTRLRVGVASKTVVNIENGNAVVSSFNQTDHLKDI
ncbi:MAG: histidine phosphatase family protein [Deltaproteobacteria bacterium]|nr:histidine phosphatase family protein [Deltaproteobacteria bacterium]